MFDKPVKKPHYLKEKEFQDEWDEYFDDTERKKSFSFLKFILIILFLAIFGLIGFYVYRKFSPNILFTENNKELPIIKSAILPFKTYPTEFDNPKPESDRRIYDAISNTGTKRIEEKEKLLPLPEEPIELKSNPILSEELENFEESKSEINLNNYLDNNINIIKNPDESQIYIQLGLYRTKDEAQKIWEELQNRNNDLLTNMKMSLLIKELGDNGILYSMQAGPFKNHAIAQFTCKKLIARGHGCLVIAGNKR